jgi:hypothetical protein
MAKSLTDRLHAGGLRKSVANSLADAAGRGKKASPKAVREAATELRKLAAELEDRAKGGPAKRKAAAKKAAATRKRNADKRKAAAKKAAATRKRKKAKA